MIAGSAWWSAVALLAASVSVHGQDIAVQLRFDGKPLQTTTPPDFSCRDDNSKMWIGCRITPEPATGTYVLTRPAPGTYTLHVAIDENQDNPARFPGDYDVFQQFAVTSDMPVVLNVDMPKLMHTTFPWDNNINLEGMLTPPSSEKMVIETLPRSRTHTASINFKWDAVAPGANYRYTISDGGETVHGTTRKTNVRLRLPRSADGRSFAFRLSAEKDGRPVGMMFTHDSGVQGWAIEFVVRHWSGRGTRGIVAPIANAALLEEWNEAIPRPAWWDDVPPQALAINSLGDLFSIWQSGGNDTSSHHRFYKLVYQAILDHSGDEHLVAEGVGLMAFVADPDDRFPLLKFGVDHFFSYQQRTDTCANCKVGDTSAGLVRDLADAYTSRGEPEAAIQIIQRLLDEREAEISAYSVALTFETMSRAYWSMKDADRAIVSVGECTLDGAGGTQRQRRDRQRRVRRR